MAFEERLEARDHHLSEVVTSGGRVWVEAIWNDRRVFLIHRAYRGGNFECIYVVCPKSLPSELRRLAEEIRKHWDGDIISGGTISGTDPSGNGDTFTSFYYLVDPSLGGRLNEGVRDMDAVIRQYRDDNGKPFLKDPKVVLADIG